MRARSDAYQPEVTRSWPEEEVARMHPLVEPILIMKNKVTKDHHWLGSDPFYKNMLNKLIGFNLNPKAQQASRAWSIEINRHLNLYAVCNG